MDKVSYALGLGIGQQLAQMGASDLNIDDFADAIKDVINGNELKVPHKDAQTIVQEYFSSRRSASTPSAPSRERLQRLRERNSSPRTARRRVW